MKIGKAMNHDIVITPSANMGFIVKIGCGRFVAADKTTLIADLEQYLSDPKKHEKLYGECDPQHERSAEVTDDSPEQPRAPGGDQCESPS